MVKLEANYAESRKELSETLQKVLNGEDVFQKYTDRDGKTQWKKIAGNNKIFFQNNYTLEVFETNSGGIYYGPGYFSFEDRMKMKKMRDNEQKKENQGQQQEKPTNKDYNSKDIEL